MTYGLRNLIILFLYKSSINVLKFSTCGRYLASAGSDATIFIWDISTSVTVARFCSHKEPIYTLDFSRDNTVLASGMINVIKIETFELNSIYFELSCFVFLIRWPR